MNKLKNSKQILNRAKQLALTIAALFSLSSCLKKDTAIELPPAGDAEVFAVNINEDYSREVYFSLSTKDTLGNNFAAWDLAFETSDNGFHIWINNGKGMYAARIAVGTLSTVNDTTGVNWMYDTPDWNVDSTAIGNWQSGPGNGVYIIDRGFDYLNPNDRFRKIIFNSVDAQKYSITFASLTDSVFMTREIFKNAQNNYTYFTFDINGQTLNLEPNKADWDILFTRYRYIYYEFYPPLQYYVNGVLLNPGQTSVAVDSTHSYQNIDYNFAKNLTYKTKRDAIGFDWKYYDFTSQHYVVRQNYLYIIKTQQGYFYKLHFIDFYNNHGVKGYPKFEFQRL